MWLRPPAFTRSSVHNNAGNIITDNYNSPLLIDTDLNKSVKRNIHTHTNTHKHLNHVSYYCTQNYIGQGGSPRQVNYIAYFYNSNNDVIEVVRYLRRGERTYTLY